MVIIMGLLGLAIYRKETRYIILFTVMVGAWFMYSAVQAMEVGIVSWLTSPMVGILQAIEMERYAWPSAAARAVQRYSQIGLAALYAVLIAGSFVLFLRRKIAEKHRKWVIACVLWVIGIFLLVFSQYSLELGRFYLFGLVPVVLITVLSFPARKIATAILIAVMCVTPVLNLTAHYAGEASWAQVLTTELKGSEFFARKMEIQVEDSFFTQYVMGINLIAYYSPNMITFPVYDSSMSPSVFPRWPEVDLSILDKMHYVFLSQQGKRAQVYGLGKDVYGPWAQTEAGKRANLLYNNGYFRIFENKLLAK